MIGQPQQWKLVIQSGLPGSSITKCGTDLKNAAGSSVSKQSAKMVWMVSGSGGNKKKINFRG